MEFNGIREDQCAYLPESLLYFDSYFDYTLSQYLLLSLVVDPNQAALTGAY
jgi:hypothetical protein